MPKAVAILEVMWDWRGMTSGAGYNEQAPEYYRISGDNYTGSRLYDWLGHYDLLVTNACPQLVTSSTGRGKPDRAWLKKNLLDLYPFELLLVCGKVAQDTYDSIRNLDGVHCRVVYVPHPAARMWSVRGLEKTKRFIRNGKHDIELRFDGDTVACTVLLPF